MERKNTSFDDQKQLKSLKNQLSGLESKISALEKEIKKIDHELLMNYDATIAKPNFFDEYQAKKTKLERHMEKWEKLTMEIENIG